MPVLLLAFLSGAPALICEVVWTRQVGLLAGNQIGAISVVVATFFGGLALGSLALGRLPDRSPSPLLIYGALEASAGLLVLATPDLLAMIGREATLGTSHAGLLALSSAAILPATFLLGGTLPALLVGASRDPGRAALAAGRILGANTAGAVLGVVLAAGLVPAIGLHATIRNAGTASIAIGLLAMAFARARPIAARAGTRTDLAGPSISPRLAILAVFLAGVATIAFEVLAARAAALIIGSTLYAWAAVLALFLGGLALGNALSASRAAASTRPARDLGLLEALAAVLLAMALRGIAPDAASPAAGFSWRAILAIGLCVLPPVLVMGAAFPYFVRLGVAGEVPVGRRFGGINAANTAGGIVGALAAPFALLPGGGLREAFLACAAMNAVLGTILLLRGLAPGRRPLAILAPFLVAAAAVPAFLLPPRPSTTRLLHVDHGAQATAAVVRHQGGRTLFVDGEAQASTGGDARATEELLAALPLLLHRSPGRFLEIGLGSGITLGAAARFPLEEIDCAEIAMSVVRSARFFSPDNRGVSSGTDPRIRIAHADGRAWLLRRRGRYDVIVGNTVQPWAVGATGLYSREYFERMRHALREGGIAAQWLPIRRIREEDLAAILRTFFDVFPRGAIWWGAENIIVTGGAPPSEGTPDAGRFALAAPALAPIGVQGAVDLGARRIALAGSVRNVVGPGEILRDDRPAMELREARRRPGSGTGALELLSRMGGAEERAGRRAAIHGWIRSLLERARGNETEADRLEVRGIAEGLPLAREERVRRAITRGSDALTASRPEEAARSYRDALAEDPGNVQARFGLAVIAFRKGDRAAAREQLEALLRDRPDHAEAWNLLGAVRLQERDPKGAAEAFERALRADPFYPEALANAGLAAAQMGDLPTAQRMLARLRAIGPGGPSPEERALARAIARAGAS